MNRRMKLRLFQPEFFQKTLSLRPTPVCNRCKKELACHYASIFQNKSVEDFGNIIMIDEKGGML